MGKRKEEGIRKAPHADKFLRVLPAFTCRKLLIKNDKYMIKIINPKTK